MFRIFGQIGTFEGIVSQVVKLKRLERAILQQLPGALTNGLDSDRPREKLVAMTIGVRDAMVGVSRLAQPVRRRYWHRLLARRRSLGHGLLSNRLLRDQLLAERCLLKCRRLKSRQVRDARLAEQSGLLRNRSRHRYRLMLKMRYRD